MAAINNLEHEYAKLLQRAGLSVQEIESHLDLSDFIGSSPFFQNEKSQPNSDRDNFNRSELIKTLRQVRSNAYLAGGSHAILQIMAREVKVGLESLNLSLPMPVFVGEFPTHDLNGCVYKVDHGALVLINSGLVFLAHHTAKIFAAHAVANQPKGEEPVTHSDRISRQVAAHLLADTFISYLFLRLGQRPKLPFRLGSFQFFVSSLVSQETVKFVLAHEFAHAIKGHLDSPIASREHELEADDTSLNILLNQPLDLSVTEEDDKKTIYNARCCAPFLFFILDDLITEALNDNVIKRLYQFSEKVPPDELIGRCSARTKASVDVHPSASERREAIFARLLNQGGDSDLLLSRSFVASADYLLPIALKIVREWCIKTIATLYEKSK